MNGRSTTSLAILAAIMIAQAAHSGGPEYEVTAIIAGFECGDHLAAVSPFALNEVGDVVGFVTCSLVQRAFRWTAKTGLELIPMPPQTSESRALGIEGSKVVGYHVISGDEFGNLGFLYDFETDQFTSLGTLPGGNYSEAMAIDQGIVVGNWGNNITGEPAKEAFIYRDGVMIGLGDDLGTPNSVGGDIANGLITGSMGQSIIFDGNAYIWDNGKVSELPPIPRGFTSEGMSLNNLQDVAGRGRMVDPDTGQTVWRAFASIDQQMIRIDPLPGFSQSIASDLNDAQQVVGGGDNLGFSAFIWEDGILTSLNDLISPNLNLTIDSAHGINQAGQITASAHSDDLDATVGVLLSPINQGTPGDLDNDGQVGVKDLLILLGNWGPCDNCDNCLADLNDDCVVGVDDLLILLGNWG